MKELFDSLEYYQNHGGILAIVIIGFTVVFVIRALDWFVWHKELKAVSLKASEDVGQHEINYHHDEIIKRTSRDRRSNSSTWNGEERRSK